MRHPAIHLRPDLRWARWVTGALAFTAVVAVSAHLGDLERLIRLVRNLSPAWLLLACAAQAATYGSVALNWQLGLRGIGVEMRFPRLLSLAVQKLFVDQTVPSGGLSGNAYIVSALDRHGVRRPDCLGVVLANLVAHYIGYLALALAAAAILRVLGLWRGWMIAVIVAFVVVCVTVPLLLLLLHRFEGALPQWIARIPGLGSMLASYGDATLRLLRSRLLLRMTLLDASVHLFDALTLWLLLHAVGAHAAAGLVFASFALGTMAAMIGPLPMGLGAFEGACVGGLASGGVPIETALVGTLLLRGWTTWLPMLPGLWLTRAELRATPAEGRGAASNATPVRR